MGVKIAVAAVALALAASPSEFVASHQQSDGGFAETGQSSDANLTAWAVLGLTAAGKAPDRSPADYLSEAPATSANDLALRILALRALGRDTGALVDRLEGMRGPNGRIGTLVNSTIWGVLALRAAGRPAGDERSLPEDKRSARAEAGPGTRVARRTRTTPLPRSRPFARRASGLVRARSSAGSRTSASSNGPMEGSRWSRAARPTRSPPPGRSRLSSPQTGSRAAELSATSRACAGPTAATATRSATP